MFPLNCSHKLATLERLLVKNFPESLKVYGTLFHINRGNPFNLELLVDSWPDFQTVITRPPRQERYDDLDHYTNSYYMFTRDIEGLRKILKTTDVVEWNQTLQIQGLQLSLDEVIRSIAAIKKLRVDTAIRRLYVKEESLQRCHSSGYHAASEKKASSPIVLQSGKSGERHVFNFSRACASHAELLNKGWGFGGNEKSLRYIQCCIRLLPSACLLDGAGNPASLGLMDQSAELRMGYTIPEYRRIGLFKHLLMALMDSLTQPDLPFYLHIAKDNREVKGPTESADFKFAHCGWYQWTCQPLESGV
ncbi:glycine N-phenylacetyltransferase-like [Lissotriton helveticus]